VTHQFHCTGGRRAVSASMRRTSWRPGSCSMWTIHVCSHLFPS
jgi:hypothetical protein